MGQTVDGNLPLHYAGVMMDSNTSVAEVIAMYNLLDCHDATRNRHGWTPMGKMVQALLRRLSKEHDETTLTTLGRLHKQRMAELLFSLEEGGGQDFLREVSKHQHEDEDTKCKLFRLFCQRLESGRKILCKRTQFDEVIPFFLTQTAICSP